MNLLRRTPAPAPAPEPGPRPAEAETLEQLWARAEAYGRVGVFSSTTRSMARGGLYRVDIEFATITGINLAAKSEFDMPLRDALQQAIERAKTIRGQFK